MKTKLNFKGKYYLILTLLLFACGGGEKKVSEAEEVKFNEEDEKIVSDITKIINDLPPPSIVPNTLRKIGSEYNPDLINDINKVESYQLDEDKASMNLGIYATDIGYMVCYGQMQESLTHMDGMKKLAETVGVSTAFDMTLMEKFEKSLNEPDSLTNILDNVIRTAETRLESSDRLAMAGLVLTGSFIEGLYLVIMAIENYDQLQGDERNRALEPLLKIILDQEKPLKDVIRLMKDIPPDDSIRKMLNELNILKYLYDSDLADISERMKDQSTDFVITEEMLIDITTEVKRIRGNIVL